MANEEIRIRVTRLSDGKTGSILSSDFDEGKYSRIESSKPSSLKIGTEIFRTILDPTQSALRNVGTLAKGYGKYRELEEKTFQPLQEKIVGTQPSVPGFLGFMASEQLKPSNLAMTFGGSKLGQAGAKGVSGATKAFGRTMTHGARNKFARRISEEIGDIPVALGRKFGSQIDAEIAKSPAQVDYSGIAEDIIQLPQVAKQALRRNLQNFKFRGDFLEKAAIQPEILSRLNFSQAQALKQAINTTPQMQTIFKGGKDVAGRYLSVISNKMRQAEIEAVPGLEKIFPEFAEGMKAFKGVSSLTKPIGAERAIFRGGETLEASTKRIPFKQVMKQTGKEKVSKEIFATKRAQGVKDILSIPFNIPRIMRRLGR